MHMTFLAVYFILAIPIEKATFELVQRQQQIRKPSKCEATHLSVEFVLVHMWINGIMGIIYP